MCFVQEGHGFGLQNSIKFGWTPKLSFFFFKYPGHIPFKRMLLDQWDMHYVSYHCCYDPGFSMKLHMKLLSESGTLCWKLTKHLFWSLKEKATHVNVKDLWSSIWGLVVEGGEAVLPQVGTVDNVCTPRCVLQSIFCKFRIVMGNRIAPPLPS